MTDAIFVASIRFPMMHLLISGQGISKSAVLISAKAAGKARAGREAMIFCRFLSMAAYGSAIRFSCERRIESTRVVWFGFSHDKMK